MESDSSKHSPKSSESSERKSSRADLYGSTYGNFATQLYSTIRAETFPEDLGQNGWLTADEQDLFIEHLKLGAKSQLLDVACGSGGPTLRIAQKTGCAVQGIDAHEKAIAEARSRAAHGNFAPRAKFDQVDASKTLPFPDASFDGLICIDAVNHLPQRNNIFAEWRRILRPGGKLVFTDPVVVTGAVTKEEFAIRASIGFFVFVPPGINEQLLRAGGFTITEVLDRTENLATIAARWRAAREAHAQELRRIEGDVNFEGQQQFFDVAARLAAERRLSRIAYCCVRAGD
jgi:SAM-dependent methyltransferase